MLDDFADSGIEHVANLYSLHIVIVLKDLVFRLCKWLVLSRMYSGQIIRPTFTSTSSLSFWFNAVSVSAASMPGSFDALIFKGSDIVGRCRINVR